MVDAAFALAKVTVPGPLVILQVIVTGVPSGTTVTEPANVAAEAG